MQVTPDELRSMLSERGRRETQCLELVNLQTQEAEWGWLEPGGSTDEL